MNRKKMKSVGALLLCVMLFAACGATVEQASSTAASTATSEAGIEVKPEETSVAGDADRLNIGTFEAQTLDAETVTQDVFADYDLTVINIWATWCPPCLEEMADLQTVYENMPENVNFFSICDDATEQRDLAIQILEDNGCTFPTLETNEQIDTNIMSRVAAFPTTLFVDSEGYVVNAIEGAPHNPSEVYLSMIDDTLAQL